MGLDSVELVLAVEEKFGITISDEEAPEIATVGDLHQTVLRKISVSDKSSCLSQRAFHLLRTQAVAIFRVPRRSVRPDTELENIIPRVNRRGNWVRFQHGVGAAYWPKLGLTNTAGYVLLFLVVAIPAAAFWSVTTMLKWNVLSGFGSSVAAMIVFGIASRYVVSPFETEFRPGFMRVRDLALVLVAQNPNLLGAEQPTWTEEEAWSLLSSVIKEQTGVTEFTKDSRIVDDLGID
jgi:hypothetical protein